MLYKVVIVEDQKHEQEALSRLLTEHFGEFRIIGIASTVPEAILLLEKTRPDLVFMDVLLPPDTSFSIIQSLNDITFEIIFTTSFEEYAVKAFRLSAIDYLIKPIALSDLRQAVNKFLERKTISSTANHIKNLVENLRSSNSDQVRIALPTLSGYTFVLVKDIVRCESDNTYTTFFTVDKNKLIVSKTLKDCEQLLQEYRFFRVHNSHLINLDFISEYLKGEGGSVKMTDGSHVEVSRRRKEEFLRALKRV